MCSENGLDRDVTCARHVSSFAGHKCGISFACLTHVTRMNHVCLHFRDVKMRLKKSLGPVQVQYWFESGYSKSLVRFTVWWTKWLALVRAADLAKNMKRTKFLKASLFVATNANSFK